MKYKQRKVAHLSSESINKKCAEQDDPGGSEEEAGVEGPEVVGAGDRPYLLGPRLLHHAGEGPLPGGHLDQLHSIDDIVHQPNPLVSLLGSPCPECTELFPHPDLEGDHKHQEYSALEVSSYLTVLL